MTDILTLTEIKKQAADLTSQINALNTAIATLNSTVATAQQLVDVSNSIHAKLTMARVNRIDATISSRATSAQAIDILASQGWQVASGVVIVTANYAGYIDVTLPAGIDATTLVVHVNGHEGVYFHSIYSDNLRFHVSTYNTVSRRFGWQAVWMRGQ